MRERYTFGCLELYPAPQANNFIHLPLENHPPIGAEQASQKHSRKPRRNGSRHDEQLDGRELAAALNRFLSGLAPEQRHAFVCRYWYCDSIGEIARKFSWSESKTKMTLLRTREKLRQYLKKEGFFV